ncbi:MAG: TonB-dependent receptor [Williamsia sp.]|nr:TonB-dependent receptor [Williamsia sp.]
MKRLYTLFCFFLCFATAAFAQKAALSGKVTTVDGSPAVNVTVSLKGTNKSVTSGENGSFTILHVKPGAYTLIVSHVGLQTQEKAVHVTDGETIQLNLTLSESSRQLEDIIINGRKSVNSKPVTVGKSGLSPMDIPQSIAIINAETIRDQQMNRLSDVMKNVNGVAYGENRGSVNETFFARGYSLGGNNVLKNGARTSTGGIPEASTLESVEVLKGSAALLYGGVTGGAVVNLVTKKPKFEWGGEASMRAGSNNLYKPTLDFYGPISNKLAFRVIGTYEKADSYRDVVKTKRFYVNPSLLYKFSGRTELIVQGDYLKSDYTPDFGIGSVGNKISPVGRNAFLNTLWAYNNTSTTTTQANLTHKFSEKWKLNALASQQTYTRDYFGAERPAANAAGMAARNLTRSKSKEYTYNEQLNITGAFKTGRINHTVLIGADADQSRTTASGFAYAPGSKALYDSINILNPATYNTHAEIPQTYIITNTLTPIIRAGAFVQDLIAITDKFKVLAGVRWTYQRTSATTIDSVLKNKQVRGTAAPKTDKAFSPKFGLIYQPLKSTSVYVSYANNFTSNSGLNVATNAPMGPSIIDQYEAGIKNDFFDGKLSANVTWYKIVNNRFAQTALFNAAGAPNGDANLKEFSGKTASDGIEVDLSGTIVKGLNFIAGYSYNYMRYTETRNEVKDNTGRVIAAGGIVEGERLVGTTKNTANGTVFYTFSSGAVKGLKLGASAYYTGKRFGGFNTSKTPSARAGLILLDGFTTFDLSAGYAYKRISVLAKLSNISNEINYFVHENYSVNPIAPRQLIATLAYKF